MADAKLPAKIGTYEIRRHLASGIMGEVYQASTMDARTKTPVYLAIKVLNPKTALRLDYLPKFRNDVRDDAVLEFKEVEYDATYQYYFVSDFLEVKPISRQSLRREPSNVIMDIFSRICTAVEKAHKKGYVHGNIKTSNVLIRRGEEQAAMPIVSDFGIGYLYDKEVFSGEQFASTFPYMSPEKVGELVANVEPKNSKLTPAADVYSLTAVLVETLTGTRPFAGTSSVEELLQAKRDRKYLMLHVNYPVCRVNIQKLNEVIRKGLSFDAGSRFASATDLGSALAACKVAETKK